MSTEMSVVMPRAFSGRLEHLGEAPAQHPVAPEREQTAPGPVAEVDGPLALVLDDPLDTPEGRLVEVSREHAVEADRVVVHLGVDLSPFALGRQREDVVDLELVDQAGHQVGVDALVLDHRDRQRRHPLDGARALQLEVEDRRLHPLAGERVMEHHGVPLHLPQAARYPPHADVHVEAAAPRVASETSRGDRCATGAAGTAAARRGRARWVWRRGPRRAPAYVWLHQLSLHWPGPWIV